MENCGFLTGLMTGFFESFENSKRRHRVDQVGKPHEGTFNWLFDPEVGFQRWLSGQQQAGSPMIFWIQGKPGSGKSTLMKYALAEKKTLEFLALADPGKWHLVPFFFHDRGSSIQKTVTGLLQELLYRLVEEDEKLLAFIPSRLIDRLLKRNKTATQVSMLSQRYGEEKGPDHVYQVSSNAETWSADDLQEALTAITGQDKSQLNVLFFIDALDEHEGNHGDLIRVIRNSFIPKGASVVNVKFCLASRPDPAFTNAFGLCPGLLVHEYTRDDVQWYARQQIASSILLRDIDPDMLELHKLTGEITQRANGVFIWVRIVIKELIDRFIDGSTISQLRDILSAVPEELKDLYQRSLSRVKPEYALESYVMTQIVLCAANPQTLKSLLEATDIALKRKVEAMSRDTMERRLRSRCGGLLEETSTSNEIQFLHQTVKTFFTNRHHATSMFRHSSDFPAEDGSYYMLKYCVYIATRLPFAELKGSSGTMEYLFYYAAESSTAPNSEVGKLLECLIQKPRCCAFFPWEVPNAIDDTRDGLQTFFLYNELEPIAQDAAPYSRHRYYDLLSVTFHSGILSYAQYKLPYDLPRTPPGQYPLLLFALRSISCKLQTPPAFLNTPKLVDWLLQRGADPNERCANIEREGTTRGSTALAIFLRDDRPLLFPLLLPDAWPPLYEAIEILLRGGADANMVVDVIRLIRKFSDRRTYAKMDQFTDDCGEIARILLKYGADCNQIDAEGYRPLYYAIWSTHRKSVELLLQHGANPSDLGNGIDAFRPESFQHDPYFYRSARKMQALLRQYSTKSEGQSRRNSIAAEDHHDLPEAQTS